MDAVSYSLASKQAQRIEKFIENPDSTSGIVTVPKTIASGETVTVPAGRVAVLPNVQVDGELTVEGEVFIPSGSSVDFSNGIKVNGEKLTMSIPTAYHIYNGSVEATNTILTNGFSTTLYTGNGSTQAINTGIDMATQWGDDASEMFGGLYWGKSRSVAAGNLLADSVNGPTKYLQTNTTAGLTTDIYTITAFTSTGVSLGSSGALNTNNSTNVGWNFQTTHRKTGVTNHGKAYTEHYNPFTGFTIIKYEGSGLAGHEIPHSLGRKLGFVNIKCLTNSSEYWQTGIENIGYAINQTNAFVDFTGNWSFADSSITIKNGSASLNASTNQYIMYGWANSYFDEDNTLIGNYEIGIYQGTGVAGNKVKTRGKPAWVMIKRLDSTGNWSITDNQRNTETQQLVANLSVVENDYFYDTVYNIDGFTLPNTNIEVNASGGQYLYMVVYDNDSGSGKSKYPKATDTTNLSINALVPYANGIDVNGSKVSIEYKNETITGLTLTQGKNYVYSKNDGTYGVNKYEPMYGSLRNRSVAGENPDYFDLAKQKWYGTTGGNELVTNGTFDVDTTGWTSGTDITATWATNSMKLTTTGANTDSGVYQIITTEIGKEYVFKFNYTNLGDYLNWQLNDGTLTSIVTSGSYSYTFTANTNNTKIEFFRKTPNAGQVHYLDNVSVFEVEPTIDTEITPRTYLDCVVYADHNGQVSYVEELPKTTYFDEIKANEFKGKNACTAYGSIDMLTTPATVSAIYGISSVIRTGTGTARLYFTQPMNDLSYSFKGNTNWSPGGEGYIVCFTNKTLNYIDVVIGVPGTAGGTQLTLRNDKFDFEIIGGKN